VVRELGLYLSSDSRARTISNSLREPINSSSSFVSVRERLTCPDLFENSGRCVLCFENLGCVHCPFVGTDMHLRIFENPLRCGACSRTASMVCEVRERPICSRCISRTATYVQAISRTVFLWKSVRGLRVFVRGVSENDVRCSCKFEKCYLWKDISRTLRIFYSIRGPLALICLVLRTIDYISPVSRTVSLLFMTSRTVGYTRAIREPRTSLVAFRFENYLIIVCDSRTQHSDPNRSFLSLFLMRYCL